MQFDVYRTSVPINMNNFTLTKGSEVPDFNSHDLDVINVRFTLVYEGVNSNGDMFTDEELRGAYGSIVNKLINWEHAEPNIGTITKAELVEGVTGGEPLHVLCEGVIMAWRYPEFADTIRAAVGKGGLAFSSADKVGISMECYFNDADYIIGDNEQIIPMSEDNGILKSLLGRSLGGKLVKRRLKNIIFGGCAVTETPAEKKARLLAVASNTAMVDGKQIFSSLSDEDFAFKKQRLLPIDTKEHVEASMKFFDVVVKALDPADADYDVSSAHEVLIESAKAHKIDVTEHVCLLCESKGGMENMKKQDNLEASESLEEPELEVTETEVAVEVAEVEEVTESAPEVEEPEVEAETETEAEVVEAAVEEVVEAEFSVESALRTILEHITSKPSEAEAAEEVAEVDEAEASEDDELVVLQKKLDEAVARADAAEKMLIGHLRVDELAKAGVAIPEEKVSAKKEFLATLDEGSWSSYLEDISEAARSAASTEAISSEATDEATASYALNLEDSNTEMTSYKSFWKTSK